ncbi:MAG: hypothetical protein IJ758_02005 [Clostridia bacterium]|nr:hypothetical protein [Clostridia bacterium]
MPEDNIIDSDFGDMEISEPSDEMDSMLIESICEKLEKDSRRYKRYLGNDGKAALG